jgi:hypothetical protein
VELRVGELAPLRPHLVGRLERGSLLPPQPLGQGPGAGGFVVRPGGREQLEAADPVAHERLDELARSTALSQASIDLLARLRQVLLKLALQAGRFLRHAAQLREDLLCLGREVSLAHRTRKRAPLEGASRGTRRSGNPASSSSPRTRCRHCGPDGRGESRACPHSAGSEVADRGEPPRARRAAASHSRASLRAPRRSPAPLPAPPRMRGAGTASAHASA